MSRGFNQCTFIGNLGDDPEMRYSQAGVPWVTFSIAVNEQWTAKNGEKQERVEWVRCKAFDKLAEIIGEYLHKGDPVFVQGKMQTDRVEDRDGGPDKFFTAIMLDKVQLISSKPAEGDRGGGRDRDDRGGRQERGRSTGNNDRSSRAPPARGASRGRDDDTRASERHAGHGASQRPAARQEPPSRHDEPFPDDDIPF